MSFGVEKRGTEKRWRMAFGFWEEGEEERREEDEFSPILTTVRILVSSNWF